MTKICRGCRDPKLHKDFSKSRAQTDGLQSHCKTCMKGYREQPGKKQRAAEAVKRFHRTPKGRLYLRTKLLRGYGLTIADYDRMLEYQGRVCAICGGDDPGRGYRNFSVDHDHESGKVRGLLCDDCNNILGRAKDRPEVLLKAAAYLKEASK